MLRARITSEPAARGFPVGGFLQTSTTAASGFEDTNPDETITPGPGRRRTLCAPSGLLVLAHVPPARLRRHPHRAFLPRVLLSGRITPDVAARPPSVAAPSGARGQAAGCAKRGRGC